MYWLLFFFLFTKTIPLNMLNTTLCNTDVPAVYCMTNPKPFSASLTDFVREKFHIPLIIAACSIVDVRLKVLSVIYEIHLKAEIVALMWKFSRKSD